MLFLSGTIRTSVQSDQSERVIHAITIATDDAIVYRVEKYYSAQRRRCFSVETPDVLFVLAIERVRDPHEILLSPCYYDYSVCGCFSAHVYSFCAKFALVLLWRRVSAETEGPYRERYLRAVSEEIQQSSCRNSYYRDPPDYYDDDDLCEVPRDDSEKR